MEEKLLAVGDPYLADGEGSRPLGQLVGEAVQRLHQRPGQLQQDAAGGCELHAAVLAVEEGGAQDPLQLLDVVADGGLADGQLLGGAGEAAMGRRVIEAAQLLEIALEEAGRKGRSGDIRFHDGKHSKVYGTEIQPPG